VGRGRWRVGRAVVAGLLLCVAALLAGCTVGPSQRPPVAVRGEHMPAPPVSAPASAPAPVPLPLPEPGFPALEFRDCTGTLSTAVPTPPDRVLAAGCALLTVEADPAQPGLGRTRIGLLRVGLADAPGDRPPLLVVGDSATQPSATGAAALAGQVPLALLQRYTLVGIDRRGAGIDDLDCGPAAARSAFVNIDPGADGTLTPLNGLLEQARLVVQDCYLVHAGALSGYRTASTASDIEQVRAALGVTRLSAIGVGDGATAVSTWARTHPGAAGRVVLDGPPNAALDEPDAAEARAAAAESAFDAFAAACAAEPTCPLGTDPRASITAFVDRLRSQPITATDGRRLTAGMTVTALLTGLGEPAGWPDLAAAIGQAQSGVPDALISRLVPLVTRGGVFDVALATACNDVQRRMTPDEVGELTRRWRVQYPLFGATTAQRLLACGPWPTAGAAAVPDPGAQLPPVLVIGTAHDPRGPLENSRRVADETPGALFLSWQGAGTGAYPRTPCVTAAVDTVLVEGTIPLDGTLCPP
jgi:pimeloyl-ACP methyl ester carboxylesterase